jgi:ribosomal protein L29
LRSNEALCLPGVKLHGSGFIVTHEQAKALGLGRVPGLEHHIRRYLNGRDLTRRSRNVMVIDLFGLTEADVRRRFPEVYQWVFERVKPERDQNNRASYRELWWIFGEPRSDLRPALLGLDRYIVTVETAQHRVFTLLSANTLPDNRLLVFALSDGFSLGVLSSRVHVSWTLAQGGTLEDRPIYTKSRCFDPFPFPEAGNVERAAIASIAEELDEFRKEQLRIHTDVTLTNLYDVLAKLRSEEPLTDREREIHDRGLVGVLRRLHDELDAAVFAAYDWPAGLGDDELLTRLVALNRERTEDEWRGKIRWLRPEFQVGFRAAPAQREMEVAKSVAADIRQAWPRELAEQFKAVRTALASQRAPAAPEQVAAHFVRARRDRVAEVLATLVSLGQAREAAPGRYAP